MLTRLENRVDERSKNFKKKLYIYVKEAFRAKEYNKDNENYTRGYQQQVKG